MHMQRAKKGRNERELLYEGSELNWGHVINFNTER